MPTPTGVLNPDNWQGFMSGVGDVSPPPHYELLDTDGRYYFASESTPDDMAYIGPGAEIEGQDSINVEIEVIETETGFDSRDNFELYARDGQFGTPELVAVVEATAGAIETVEGFDFSGYGDLRLGVNDDLDDGTNIGGSMYGGTVAVRLTGPAPPPDPGEAINCECNDERPPGQAETLEELRGRLMVRLGFAAQLATPPPGMTELLNDFLISANRLMHRRHAALRQQRFFTWPLEEGVRFYGIRENRELVDCSKYLDPYRVQWVGVREDSDWWYPLIRGIPPHLYTTSSFFGRPNRYEIRQCIEIFPKPDSQIGDLVVIGRSEPGDFAADEDVPSIDSELVFLTALARAKAHYNQNDAITAAEDAAEHLRQLTAGTHAGRRYVPGTRQAATWQQPRFLPLEDD